MLDTNLHAYMESQPSFISLTQRTPLISQPDNTKISKKKKQGKKDGWGDKGGNLISQPFLLDKWSNPL